MSELSEKLKGLRDILTKKEIDDVIINNNIVSAFERYIKKCKKEIEKIDNGSSQVFELTDTFGNGLIQERYEFVGTLLGRIEFIMQNPDKECVV